MADDFDAPLDISQEHDSTEPEPKDATGSGSVLPWGVLKGKIGMLDNFDDPLDEMKDYV